MGMKLDSILGSLAEWYPTNALARKAIERAKVKVGEATTLQIRQAWETDLANLQRLVAARRRSPK